MWNKQQVAAVVISLIVTNCFIQISCNIISNTSSVELIDNIIDSNNNHDKSEKYIEVDFPSEQVNAFGDDSPCSCEETDEGCLYICQHRDTNDNVLTNMFLLTAGEILLGTAIIMGLSALVTLLLRTCTRSRIQRNGRDIPDFLDAFERNENRASLTSLQQTVISKLRDRPPRYETRHNYEYRQREDVNTNSEHPATSIRNVSVLNPNASRSNEPPPPYEPVDDANSVHELPPAYTISLSTHDDSSSSRDVENRTDRVGGIANQSFTCDDNQQEHQQQGRTNDDTQNNRSENNIRRGSTRGTNRTCDSVLYI